MKKIIFPAVTVAVAAGVWFAFQRPNPKTIPERSRAEWQQLMRTSPEQAVAALPSRADWEALPPERQAEVPEPVEGMAELVVEIVGCDVDHPHNHAPRVEPKVVLDGRMFAALPEQIPMNEPVREPVAIRGGVLDGEIAFVRKEIN